MNATPNFRPRFLIAALLIAGITSGNQCVADESRAMDEFFETHVRPVLVKKCLSCHGPQKQEGGLRLDSREGVLKGGENGAAAVPKEPAASHLVQAIRYDGDLKMPPDQKLADAQRDALIHWVELGMPWPKSIGTLKPVQPDTAKTHWAFQPVTDPPVPMDVKGTVRTPVDAFVLQRLQEAQLSPSPEADRRTLIRRITYALTGLPPTPSAVESFVSSDDPNAYDKVVEELLASPAHGEHWARHWLDIARYSDTKGYVYAREERFWVHAWNYRDWVVSAFNSDMPYDRFLLLQIAADQVPDRNEDDLAAMGFLTLGRRFLGVRRDIIDDQIDVVCRGTMSLTVGCARCHDHKYDPIPTSDYYSLYGVFDSSREWLVPLPGSADEGFLKEYREKSEAIESLLQERRASTSARVRSRVADYLKAQLELDRYPEEGFDQIISTEDLLPSFVHRWRDFLRDCDRNGDPVFVAWHMFRKLPPESFSAMASDVTAQLRALPADKLNPRIAKAFETVPTSFAEVIDRYASVLLEVDKEWQAQQDQAKASGMEPPASLVDASAEQIRAVLYSPGKPCFVPNEPVVSTEYDFDSGTCNELWKRQVEIDRLILNAPTQPRFAVAMKDRSTPVTPRVFRRGNPANKGDDVPRQFLSLLSGPNRQPFAEGSGRLELAKAIIDPANPLTARVIVNRVWAQYFGRGLVNTPGDFGLRADAPSHPELLDWLTTRFVQEGWSLKKLHRMIVLSATFRQSSIGPDNAEQREAALQLDPGNRLLWRMNVHRLTFEELRDSLLAVSGQLETTVGGKPRDLFASPYHRRRTLYGLVDRQFLPGTLRMFDFANPDLHIPQRSETTVPQQSLFLMNHPLAIERARELAKSVASSGDATSQVRQLFRQVFQRDATDSQLVTAMELLAQEATEKPPEASPTAADWSYGYGAINEAEARIRNFTALPYFSGTAWQGGPSFPDGPLGWVQISAKGGHPGNDRDHACIRRWTAPRDMKVRIQSELIHEPEQGDGIRSFIVHSRTGILNTSKAHKQKVASTIDPVEVKAGETIDFLIDIDQVLNSDQFLWQITLEAVDSAGQKPSKWNAEADFPKPSNPSLTPLEQLAQVLLCSNEFLFVD